MAVTPTGQISLRLEDLRTLVANCAAWRSWTQTATVAAAKEKVYLVDLPPPAKDEAHEEEDLVARRPFAVVDEFEAPNDRSGADAFVMDRASLGAFQLGGRLLLSFEDDVPPEDAGDPAAAKLRFMNNVGAVLQEIKALGAGENDLLSVHRVARWEPWRRSPKEEEPTQGDYMRVSFVVTWGI